MKKLTSALTTALGTWTGNCAPIRKGDPVAIAGLDRSNRNASIDQMFFAEAADHLTGSGNEEIGFFAYEKLNTGTLRNSFFPELFIHHSKIRDLRLHLHMTGAVDVKVECSTRNGPVKTLYRKEIAVPEGLEPGATHEVEVDVSLDTGLARHSRLFWQTMALSDETVLHRGEWEAIAPTDTNGRMLVLLRTFGRTADIADLLKSFQEQAGDDHGYRHVLQNTLFVVLDTSNGVTADDYTETEGADLLNTFIFSGPNMGGGGNMSQILLAVQDAVEEADVEIDELLLLDDDLSLSLESLRRHWASTLFRSDDTIFTLPVFMKSEPQKMWEDGAFWGRFLGDDALSDRDTIAPRLLRHNLEFKGFDHVDEMAHAHYPEYSTFIFLSLPYDRFLSLGYPVAFFLRGDDIEYSLRNGVNGGKTMSNPNIAAWHEPAHSYAQEYMSIAHGVIINMAYGQDKVDEFTAFFDSRAKAHICIGDALGVKLYASILRDLVARNVFLEHGFSDHYIAKLKLFKTFDAAFEYIPDDVIDSYAHASERRGGFVGRYAFLYMPLEGHPGLDRVVLENPHTGHRRVYQPHEASNRTEVIAAAAELYSALDEFSTSFGEIRSHYGSRLQRSYTRDFWVEEMAEAKTPVTMIRETLAES